MTEPLVLALVWLIVANVIAMLPSRDHHWRAAYRADRGRHPDPRLGHL